MFASNLYISGTGKFMGLQASSVYLYGATLHEVIWFSPQYPKVYIEKPYYIYLITQ